MPPTRSSPGPTLIQPLVLTVALGIDTLAASPYWIHPALTEVVESALLDLDLESGVGLRPVSVSRAWER
ncbi:hypothetical protein [Streptomyces erythrochromogenes]|uniref:hypothetical protein n=1 Tax=Streptomyces erythrochromogenes TaxID=285574 RepID=UPI00386776AD|nr:hypothetical protein OG364_37460 [Streptomyces erythrochromogenes]